MSIGQRISVIVILPIIALMGFSGWILSERWSESVQMQNVMAGSGIIATVNDLVSNFQRERGRSALFLGSKGTQYGQELTAQRQTTDDKRGVFIAAAQPAILAQLQPAVAKSIEEANGALVSLNKLREAVSNQSIAAGDASKTYSAMIDRFLTVSLVIVHDIDRSQVKNAALASSLLQRASERAGITRATGSNGLAAGGFSVEQLVRLANLEAEEAEFISLFKEFAPPEIRAAYTVAANSAGAVEVSRLRQTILAAKPGEPVTDIDGAQWFKAATAHVDMLVGIQDQLLRTVVAGATGGRDEANWQVATTAAIAAIVMAVILGLGIVTTRSVTRPIVAMVSAMRRLAAGDLSVEIPATRRKDEIGQMAKAVLVFQQAAVENARLEREAAGHRARAEGEHARNEQAQREATEQERAIVKSSIGTALTKLEAKDLTYRMTGDIHEAYRQLQTDFNAAIGQLEDAMRSVTGSTNMISSGSREILTASDDLSLRTEQQAASLEETAAALDEITATVKKSAEGASHARQVVTTADQDAKKSILVVRQTVEAMDGIAKSSQQINQIIGVIDEIAFQTNLLALNAGVEAARAGDAGKGFAVVASEVRALAQRSAEAAKEIKGLISASTTQVDYGVKLVAETGKSLERIMAQVSEINDVVSAIAAGAHEQAEGLEQINTAINQMDQATQRNAAMVEESTAASHSLSQETDQLAGLVGQFQVGRPGGGDTLRAQLQKAAPHAFRQPAKTQLVSRTGNRA